jgi:riboflavin-specific deaminase-like protein
VDFTRLYPRHGEATEDDLAGHLDLGSRAPAMRPYLVLNMVSTLDGKAVVEGNTRGLGGDHDRALFHRLRTQADAIMAGAGTVRIERYGKAVKSPELRALREREGLDPDPPTIIVSGSLNLPADLPLLQEPGAKVLIATGAEHELEGVQADVEYLRVGDDLALLAGLLRERGIRSILCEGGPTLNAYLLSANLVDELFLSQAPKLTGGAAVHTIVDGKALTEPRDAELVWLAEGGGELFGRWRIIGA